MPRDINLGASLRARQGYAQPYRSSVSALNGGTITVILDPIGDIRFDNVYELDLRLAKDFRFMNRVGMTLSGDLFNAPNKRTVLQREGLVINNAAAGNTSRGGGNRITELQSPRIGVSARSSTSKFRIKLSKERPAGSSGGPFFVLHRHRKFARLLPVILPGGFNKRCVLDQWIESHASAAFSGRRLNP